MIGRLLCLIGLHKDEAVEEGPDLDWRAAKKPADQLTLLTANTLFTRLGFECQRCGRILH